MTQHNANRLTTVLTVSIGISLLVLNTGFAGKDISLSGRSCESIIKDLKDEIDRINELIEMDRTKLNETKDKIFVLKSSLPQIKIDLENATQRSKGFQNQLYAFAQQSDDVKATLNKNSEDFSAAENNLLDLMNKLASNKKNQKKPSVKSQEKEKLKIDELKLIKDIEVAKNSLSDAKTKMNSTQSGWESLQSQAKSAQQQVTDLQTKLSKTEKELKSEEINVKIAQENLDNTMRNENETLIVDMLGTKQTKVEWYKEKLLLIKKGCNVDKK